MLKLHRQYGGVRVGTATADGSCNAGAITHSPSVPLQPGTSTSIQTGVLHPGTTPRAPGTAMHSPTPHLHAAVHLPPGAVTQPPHIVPLQPPPSPPKTCHHRPAGQLGLVRNGPCAVCHSVILAPRTSGPPLTSTQNRCLLRDSTLLQVSRACARACVCACVVPASCRGHPHRGRLTVFAVHIPLSTGRP